MFSALRGGVYRTNNSELEAQCQGNPGGSMNKAVLLILIVCGTLLVLSAYARQPPIKPYLDGTTVPVDKHEPAARVRGGNPSDARLADPETYTCDIAVHVN